MKDVRALLNDIGKGSAELAQNMPETMKAFGAFTRVAGTEGALDRKQKELISVALGVFARCDYCIASHVRAAYAAGCTRKEILDAGMVAIAFSGGPGYAYSSTTLLDSVNEFEHDFDKK